MTVAETTPAGADRRPPRRWRRRVLVLGAVVVVVLTLAPLALGLSPVRNLLARSLSNRLGVRVEIGESSAFWFSGVDLGDVTIHSPQDPAAPLASVPSVHIDADLLGLMAGGGSISVVLDAPRIALVRDAEGKGNLDPLLEALGGDSPGPARSSQATTPSPGPRKSGPDISIQVGHGEVSAELAPPADARPASAPATARRASLVDISLSARMGASTLIACEGRLPEASPAGGDVGFTARLAHGAARGTEFSLGTSGALDLARIQALIGGVLPVQSLSGRVEIQAQGRHGEDSPAAGRAQIEGHEIRIALTQGREVTLGRVSLQAFVGAPDAGAAAPPAPAGMHARGGVVPGGVEVRIAALGASGPGGDYREPNLVVTARGTYEAAAQELTVSEARVMAGTRAQVRTEGPVVLALGEVPALSGSAAGSFDLAQLSPLLSVLGVLPAGEHSAGTVSFDTQGTRSAAGETTFSVRVIGDGLRLPMGGLAGGTPRQVAAEIHGTQSKDHLALSASAVQAPGLGGTFALEFSAGDKGLRPTEGQFSLRLDLAASGPWLHPLLGLAPGTRTAGVWEGDVRLSDSPEGRRLEGESRVRNFSLQSPSGKEALQIPAGRVVHDLSLDPHGSGLRASVLRTEGFPLDLDLSGSEVGGDAFVLAARATGDASRLAQALRPFLGPSLADLSAEGSIAGRLAFSGASAADVSGQGEFGLGTWQGGGANLETARLTLARAGSETPLDIRFSGALEGGSLEASLGVDLDDARAPWSGRVRLEDVDTSDLVTSTGLGRFLTFLLPALLPAEAAVPVLQGRLDGEAQLGGPELGAADLAASMSGTAHLEMAEGEVKQSTLFSGRGEMGRLVSLLETVDRDIGRTLASVSKSMVFSSLRSRARIDKGTIHVEDMQLIGPYTDLNAHGTVQLDERVALEAELLLKEKAGASLTALLGKATIPLSITGRLGSPDVKPRLDPKVLLEKAARGELPGLLEDLRKAAGDKNPLDRLKDLFGR